MFCCKIRRYNCWRGGNGSIYGKRVAEYDCCLHGRLQDFPWREKVNDQGSGFLHWRSSQDPHVGVGGLLHVMLPHYCGSDDKSFVAAKYADTGLDEMINELVMQGAKREHLVAKIAGGAHMIRTAQVPESEDISSRNLEAVKQKLGEMSIPLLAADVGEYWPRTVVFEPASGSFRILTPGKEEKVI